MNKGVQAIRQPTGIPFRHDDGGRAAAGYNGFTGDCVCRSIVIASGLPYQFVYDQLADGNAAQRRGKRETRSKAGVRTAARGINTKRKWFKDYMHELGFVWTSTMAIAVARRCICGTVNCRWGVWSLRSHATTRR